MEIAINFVVSVLLERLIGDVAANMASKALSSVSRARATKFRFRRRRRERPIESVN